MTVETLERYAYENGLEKGIATGAQQKAVEDALILINKYHASPEEASEQMNAPNEVFSEAVDWAIPEKLFDGYRSIYITSYFVSIHATKRVPTLHELCTVMPQTVDCNATTRG